MKYTIPAVLICDHCGKNAPGAMSVVECGPARVQNVVMPAGWLGEQLEPAVVRTRVPETVDLLKTPPAKVASIIGAPVRALWCSTDCQTLARGHETLRLVQP